MIIITSCGPLVNSEKTRPEKEGRENSGEKGYPENRFLTKG
jgi:hypothetical protein